jgi:hypothetical protein
MKGGWELRRVGGWEKGESMNGNRGGWEEAIQE